MATSLFLDKAGLSHLCTGIKTLLADKAGRDEATVSSPGLMSAKDKAILEAISGVYDATIE